MAGAKGSATHKKRMKTTRANNKFQKQQEAAQKPGTGKAGNPGKMAGKLRNAVKAGKVAA